MELYVARRKAGMIIAVQGRLDAASAPDFTRQIEALMTEQTTYCVVNGTGLDYITSAGLQSVLSIGKTMHTQGGKLVFASLQQPVYQVFEMTGFHNLFQIFASEDDALAAV
jgi:anti-anti-sigma factor